MYKTFVGAVCLLALLLSIHPASAQSGQDKQQDKQDDNLLELSLETEGISIARSSGYFWAPYLVQPGETFQSISRKFYGTENQAELLAKAAHASVADTPTPGTTILIVAQSFLLKWNSNDSQKQINIVRAFLQRVNDRQFRSTFQVKVHVVNKVTTDLSVSELRLVPASVDHPTLVFKFAEKPLLEVFAGETHLDSVTME